ncbi:MAG: YjbQ family protein [Candidatus Omnitrophica bacterium]|nr:YjbQ family protein [Candidatus Omnitrophota bacterium]
MKTVSISTRSKAEFLDITSKIEDIVRESKVKSGTCHIFIAHTTAGITINENADPSVKRDILDALERLVPSHGGYAHAEGNAPAHIKSTLVGMDKTVFIEDGRLKLGTWQGIFFCEFDGPRQRNVFIDVVKT